MKQPNTQADQIYSIQELEILVEQLNKQSRVAHYDLGFLRATVDNPVVGEKISSSYSGHALDTAIRAVFKSTVMYVVRSWDRKTIPMICRSLGVHATTIEADRFTRHPSFPTTFLEIGQVENKLTATYTEIEAFLETESFKAIRLYRDEHHAHLNEGSSRTRQHLAQMGAVPASPSYRAILSAGEETARIVAELSRVLTFSVDDFEGRIKISETNTRQFWTVLPPLSILEAAKSNDEN